MVETNPDFERQRVELVMQVQAESQKLKELDASLVQFKTKIVEIEQQVAQKNADIYA